MTTQLFLERTFDPPLSVREVLERGAQQAWCFEMYRVNWVVSFLAAGGRAMVCWFTAPDMESARQALRKAGTDTSRLWSGTVHEGAASKRESVLVERSFEAPVSIEEIQAREDAARWCLDAHNVRFSRTFFSVDRKRMLCLYEAPDAESVRLAQREAGMPFEAVWSFERIAP